MTIFAQGGPEVYFFPIDRIIDMTKEGAWEEISDLETGIVGSAQGEALETEWDDGEPEPFGENYVDWRFRTAEELQQRAELVRLLIEAAQGEEGRLKLVARLSKEPRLDINVLNPDNRFLQAIPGIESLLESAGYHMPYDEDPNRPIQNRRREGTAATTKSVGRPVIRFIRG